MAPQIKLLAPSVFSFSLKMKIQHKILACAETGEDYLAVIAWGRADLDVMREVFLSVAEITKSMGACRVLIDLR
jgi:hypothetical protein